MSKGINVLSCFDGMSCGLVALKKAGMLVNNYFASEIDKYASAVARFNHPEIKHLGDIENYQSWELPKIDLIIGGSPCQGFSFAGKQQNFDDPRSALVFKFVECVWKFKPKYFLMENVKMKKEHSGVISELLEVEPVEINSALVSAQNRRRLYWCNWEVDQPEDKGVELRDIIDGVGYLKNHGEWKEKSDKANCICANYHKGVDNRGQRTMVFTKKSQTWDTINAKENFRKLTPIECERLQTLPDFFTETGDFGNKIKPISNSQRYKMIGNGWTIDVISHILRNL